MNIDSRTALNWGPKKMFPIRAHLDQKYFKLSHVIDNSKKVTKLYPHAEWEHETTSSVI